MGDFYQNGIITTLHNLSRRPVEEQEKELMSFRKERPMSLVLPSLYSELEESRHGRLLPEWNNNNPPQPEPQAC